MSSAFLKDVIDGLSAEPKTLPARWFYDEQGSELFEQITDLPEYYLTRAEVSILRNQTDAIAKHIGPEATLVEYGAGALTKTRILLGALDRPSEYVPIDISEEFLKDSAAKLAEDFPQICVRPVVADFINPVDMPPLISIRKSGFFPGSTIGNMDDEQIHTFLSTARDVLGADATFVIGYDRVKDPATLIAAYDDEQKVTAQFNRNVLHRINRELGGDFEPARFKHEARWNAEKSRIEMHLVADGDQSVTIDGWHFPFRDGESIHTENCRKFTDERMADLAYQAGWRVERVLTDADQQVSLGLWRACKKPV